MTTTDDIQTLIDTHPDNHDPVEGVDFVIDKDGAPVAPPAKKAAKAAKKAQKGHTTMTPTQTVTSIIALATVLHDERTDRQLALACADALLAHNDVLRRHRDACPRCWMDDHTPPGAGKDIPHRCHTITRDNPDLDAADQILADYLEALDAQPRVS